MPASMTGFGRAELKLDSRVWVAEISSVNSRYFEFSLRSPTALKRFEALWRRKIREASSRGKIELRVSLKAINDSLGDVLLDEGRARSYLLARQRLADLLGLDDPLSAPDRLSWVLGQPEVLGWGESEAVDAELESEAEILIDRVIAAWRDMRQTEGRNISLDLLQRLDQLEGYRGEIVREAAETPIRYRERLEERVSALFAEEKPEYYDGQRVAAEIAIFADKIDVQEELTRLASHFTQARQLLSETCVPVGKKLDFLVQEMNRETNTIGSKANNLQVTQRVLDMKTGIEQIREQIQNLE